MDDLEYLLPDFDLNSLTVPRLRSILVSHDVPYPASAKKTQLIRILQDEVLSQAEELVREREHVRRTSEGITDMGSRASSIVPSDIDSNLPRFSTPPVSSTATDVRKSRSRRSTRASVADTDDDTAPTTPVASLRTESARAEARYSRASDKETWREDFATPSATDIVTPRKSASRKLRGSEMHSLMEPMIPARIEPTEESVFTDDNPFQSGSPLATPVHGRARRSRAQKSEASPVIRRGSNIAERSSYSVYMSPVKEESAQWEEADEISAGEEFTPEEQLEMEREQADMLYPHNNRSYVEPRKQSTISNTLAWLFIISLFGTFGAWWRKEKIEIGFCGIGKANWSLADTKIPQWASILEPHCEICPAHAFCYPNLEVRCEHDFILKPHPLSLGGLIPLPPTCEADSEKARRAKAVANKAIEELRNRRARWECGELKDGGKDAKSPEIGEPTLREEIAKKRRKGMSEVEFDDLWKSALGEVIGREEVMSRTKQPSGILFLTSTSVTRLPLACSIRRYVRLAFLTYRLPLSVLILFGGGLAYVRSWIRARRSDMARVPELVTTALNQLAVQAALHARGETRNPYLPIGQLRDDILRSELRGQRREQLWKRVRSVVEENANIRAAVREGPGGDVSRVWEWVGGISSVAEADRMRRKESNFPRISPEKRPYETDMSDERVNFPRENKDPGDVHRWNEGRPIY